jgi:hypothetical protein
MICMVVILCSAILYGADRLFIVRLSAIVSRLDWLKGDVLRRHPASTTLLIGIMSHNAHSLIAPRLFRHAALAAARILH